MRNSSQNCLDKSGYANLVPFSLQSLIDMGTGTRKNRPKVAGCRDLDRSRYDGGLVLDECAQPAAALEGCVVVLRFASGPLVLVIGWVALVLPAFAADNYQTNIGPAPLDASNRANVLGRGTVLATLEGNKFTVHGTFAGLATPATDAHLCLGNVMGGIGPVIYDVTVSQAQNGEVSGTAMFTSEEVAALKAGKIYVLIDSQKAPKGNLWGWFQPAHVTVGPDVPQEGSWYLPNILKDDTPPAKKKAQG
jgi:CHRD domain